MKNPESRGGPWCTPGDIHSVTKPNFPSPGVLKKCQCGMGYNLAAFRTLPLCGVQTFDDGQEPSKLELRDCACGSTIAVALDKHGQPWCSDD